MAQKEKAPTILIAEDSDDDFENVVRSIRKSSGVAPNLIRCENGRQLLDYFFNANNEVQEHIQYPSLILMDLNMPGISGNRLIIRIKSNEMLRIIPIVVLTTSGDEHDVVSCYSAGANSYLKKPEDPRNLTPLMATIKNYWFEISRIPQR